MRVAPRGTRWTVHRILRRVVVVLALITAAVSTGCDPYFFEPAPPLPSQVALSLTVAAQDAGDHGLAQEAFDGVDGAWVRIGAGGETLIEREVSVEPADEGLVTERFEIELGPRTGALSVQAELRQEGFTVFEGAANVLLEPGREVALTLPMDLVEIRLEADASCSVQPNHAVATFEDADLEAVVRAGLGAGPDEALTCGRLASLGELEAIGTSIGSIVGIQNLTGLTTLRLQGHDFGDIGSLAALENLTFLHLHANGIEDVSPLAGLTSLRHLHLAVNEISDIGPLSGLENLTFLNLRSNAISDVSALSELTRLYSLALYFNDITDIGPLNGLTGLRILSLHTNSITDITPLSGLTNLQSLQIDSNNLTDISAVGGLTDLTYLSVARNSVSDIGPLSGLTNLTEVRLFVNPISDIQPLLDNPGIGAGDRVSLWSTSVSCDDVAALVARGVIVESDCP